MVTLEIVYVLIAHILSFEKVLAVLSKIIQTFTSVYYFIIILFHLQSLHD